MFKLGFIGAGSIASDIAQAIESLPEVELAGVASRRFENAKSFAQRFKTRAYDSWQKLLDERAIHAVYICTPTCVREEICLEAAIQKKHILAEKPFLNSQSLRRIQAKCQEQNLVFMDATHFSHNPRTQMVREALAQRIGKVQHLRSSFFFPADDVDNIRFQPAQEPTGAVGDLGWYNMRAICEFLTERGKPERMVGALQHHPQTGSVIRGSGWVVFETGQTSSFDFGYSVGAQLMELDLLGDQGVIQIPDYVLDYKQSYIFQNPEHKISYSFRRGVIPQSEAQTIVADSDVAQHILMVENFARLCRSGDEQAKLSKCSLALQTQDLLDLFWESVNKK